MHLMFGFFRILLNCRTFDKGKDRFTDTHTHTQALHAHAFLHRTYICIFTYMSDTGDWTPVDLVFEFEKYG